jgi:hypothetical protein
LEAKIILHKGKVLFYNKSALQIFTSCGFPLVDLAAEIFTEQDVSQEYSHEQPLDE